ncbi:MAG TPA: hypothetical protein VFP84_38520 [Kofleriaceae bacterium]|nr:hypothetical protein [Kofleriaceae bacterium]
MRRALWLLVLAGCNQLLGLEPPPAPGGTGNPDAAAGGDAPIATGRTPYWTFSDDFELGDFRRWSTGGTSPDAVLEVDHTVAAAGCCSMHARINAGAVGVAYKLITLQGDGPGGTVTAGTLAMRARIKATQLAADTREIAIVQGGTSGSQFVTSGLGQISGGGFGWGYDATDAAVDNRAKASTATVDDALGGWHCIEVVINLGDAGHVAIFSDDLAVPLVEDDFNTLAQPGWDSATFGLPFSSGSALTELYLDDAVVSLYHDSDRGIHIGCK